ncbi:MAG: DUF87 domain-containing protein [Gemmatimonadota bacterium]
MAGPRETNPPPVPAAAIEGLGSFYLGRLVETPGHPPYLYDARDLTTHAVAVGMTGSGKTGLCLTLLEEAALDGIPAIAIDPKGDVGNLLLTFPGLAPSDFRPWVDEAEAARREISPDELAARTAELWRAGLAESGQDGGRIARLRAAVDLPIYTPGARHGLPLAVLRSFTAPAAAVRDDADALADRVSSAVSGLLALIGEDADPLRSREHILLSRILLDGWREGRDFDLASLIRSVQEPGFSTLGVMGLESFFPAGDRFGLATRLNQVAAAPGFEAWREGDPLDVERLLWTADGRPRISTLSIGHLSERERMFVVTLVLNELLAWVRSRPGSTSLQAILYIDEAVGFVPPTRMPPSKPPLLTLLKQARAFGLGVVLATQNPVDLDYKGLGNAGTWFLGRLQTGRDKERVLDGLEGVAAGPGLDRRELDRALSGLESRTFLVNNVHEESPLRIRTRWALSYLRGPLSRDEIRRLMDERGRGKPEGADAEARRGTEARPGAEHDARTRAGGVPPGTEAAAREPVPEAGPRPLLPPDVPEVFLVPVAEGSSSPDRVAWEPCLLGRADLHYARAALGVDLWQEVAWLAPLGAGSARSPWEAATELPPGAAAPVREPPVPGPFVAPPPAALTAAARRRWESGLRAALHRDRPLRLWRCATLGLVSEPGESEGTFRARAQARAREARDEAVTETRAAWGRRVDALEGRIRRAEDRLQRERSQYDRSKLDGAVSVGSTLLGALLGRRSGTRASTAARRVGRAAEQRDDVVRAERSIEELRAEMAELETGLAAALDEVRAASGAEGPAIEEVSLPPRKSEIGVRSVALAWRAARG